MNISTHLPLLSVAVCSSRRKLQVKYSEGQREMGNESSNANAMTTDIPGGQVTEAIGLYYDNASKTGTFCTTS